MNRDKLIEERNMLFNEDWSLNSTDIDKIINFCNFLTEFTGIQCCTARGYIFDHMPAVYKSVIEKLA